MDVKALNRVTLPVSAWAYQGAADLQGILSFDGESLRLGFQTADALFGLIKSKPKELHLRLDQLEHAELRRGWFWLMPYVELQFNDFMAVAGVPGSESGRLRLSVRLRDRRLAQKLVGAVLFGRAQALHAALDEGITEPPPIRTPATAEQIQHDTELPTPETRRRELE